MTGNHDSSAGVSAASLHLRQMSAHDLSRWGVGVLAYVKKISLQDGEAYAIHGADGEPLGVAPSREVAFAGLRQNDLEPISVH